MSACEACGEEPCQGHHWTGKDHQGRYLDPLFAVPLCKDHHPLVHDQWKTLDLETVARPLPWFERIEERLRRWAATLMVLDGGSRGSLFALTARVLVSWADELAKGTRRLDEGYPTWREDQGFYPD